MRPTTELQAAPARPLAVKVLLAAAACFLALGAAAQAADICAVTGQNYIKDSDFALEIADPKSKYWTSGQHAGEASYETELKDGELTIRKTGTEPWFVYRQRIESKELGAKKIAFTAELKLDLQLPEHPGAFPVGGGLQLIARAPGRKILRASTLQHEPRMGSTDWQQIQVVIQLPAKTAMVDVGFLLQADGTLQVRNPSLRQVDESEVACKAVPK